MSYIQLFLSFLQIGAFSFGGGYAAMPLIQNQVGTLHHWLTAGEFNDLVTISQMTPGPIAVNSATFVGLRIAGLPGAVIATAGCILPSCILVSALAYVYTKYKKLTMLQGILNTLRPAVVAMIATAGMSIIITSFWGEAGFSLPAVISGLKVDAVLIFAAALFVLRRFDINPIYVMVLAGVCQTVITAAGGMVG